MNPKSVWPLAAIIVAGMLAVTLMVLFHADAALILTVATIMLITVPSTFLAGQQGQTQAAVQAVQQQTNGNQGRLVDILEAQGKMLAAMHPPSAGLSAPTPAAPPDPAPEPPPPGGAAG